MTRKLIVAGRKNPETDTIVSALAYAELPRPQGIEGIQADCQGGIWRETRFILEWNVVPVLQRLAWQQRAGRRHGRELREQTKGIGHGRQSAHNCRITGTSTATAEPRSQASG